MKLQGKIAIVTGAGKGIGREAALAIAAEGATVAAVARTRSDLDETVRLIEDNGGLAVSLSHDLTVGSVRTDRYPGQQCRRLSVRNLQKYRTPGDQALGMVRRPVGSDHQD